MLDYDEFLELARTRQSIRTWSDEAVEMETVRKLIEAAQEAPTSCNHQMNRFVVVTDEEILTRLVDEAGAVEWIENAPIAIVNMVRMGWNHNKSSVIQSLGMAEQHILLSATSLGLVGLIQAGIGDTETIKEILDIPDGYYIASIISLGHPADGETYPRPPRLPVDDVMSVNSFDEPRHLQYPRKDVSTDLSDYSNSDAPDSVWDPEAWPLEAIGTFRGNALWSSHPRPEVDRPNRMRPEFDLEIEFFEEHIDEGHRFLEFLPYSAAYGAKLKNDPKLADNHWDVFELSDRHEPYIEKRCAVEGVDPPDDYYHGTDWDRDLPETYDRIVVARGLNHIPLSADVFDFLARNLADDGRLLLSFKNKRSFELLRWYRIQKGQVWNFGPYKPVTMSDVRVASRDSFDVETSEGISLTPSNPSRRQSLLQRVCRTRCLTLRKRL